MQEISSINSMSSHIESAEFPARGRVASVADFPDVPNVCRQTLKELWRGAPHGSLAHVVMAPDDTSLLHRHDRLSEVYVVLSGSGYLTIGEERVAITKDSVAVIPPGVPHKVENGPAEALVHLVICAPAFDPADVVLLEAARDA